MGRLCRYEGVTMIGAVGHCCWEDVDCLKRQLAAANERAWRYRSALRSLVNEVGASAGAFEDEVREAVGNTNYACLMDKVEQARKALEVPDAL
jgi:hypothetical protein